MYSRIELLRALVPYHLPKSHIGEASRAFCIIREINIYIYMVVLLFAYTQTLIHTIFKEELMHHNSEVSRRLR